MRIANEIRKAGGNKKAWLGILMAFVALQVVMTAAWAAASASILASRQPISGQPGDSYSYAPVISYSSRWVVFHSLSKNLDPMHEETGSNWDIFLFDRDSDRDSILDNVVWTENITFGSNGDSQYPSLVRNSGISTEDEGRYVVFQSTASSFGAYNWSPPHVTESDPGPYRDVFIFDDDAFLGEGGIFAVSVPAVDGAQSNAASGSPGRIPFSSDNSVHPGADIYLRGVNNDPYVVFESLATNLVNGTYLRLTGPNWAPSTLPTSSTLYAVHRVAGTSQFWFGGAEGTLLRLDNEVWTDYSGVTTNALYGLSFSSTANGFAVGENGVILRWNGSAWSTITSPTASTLYGVTLVSPSDGWAVGAGGMILRWNGSAWSTVTSPTANTLRSIDYISSANVFAVGDGGTIVRWNGTVWSTVTSPTTYSLFGVSRAPLANQMWAVGENGTFVRYNGVSWQLSTPDVPTTQRLNAVSMVDSSEGWAVGNLGILYHYYNGPSGTLWYAASSPTTENLYGVATQNSISAWAVGVGGSNGKQHIYLRNVWRDIQSLSPGAVNTILTRNASNELANGDSTHPVVSSSGRFLAFVSYATNLVSGFSGVDGTKAQVYLLDRDFDNGSPNGTYDEFSTPNGVKIYLISRNLVGNGTAGNGDSWTPDLVELDTSQPSDGIPDVVRVTFSSSSDNLLLPSLDTNNFRDVFMTEIDLATQGQTIQRVSTSSEEEEGNNISTAPAISGDGKVVSFTSYATNLVAFDTNLDCYQNIGGVETLINCPDIFAHDVVHDVTWRASLTTQGLQAQSDSGSSRLDGNGRFVAFATRAQLTADGSSGIFHQIYLRDQGIPAGNPVILPSSWDFPDTAPGELAVQTFTLKFLGPLEINGTIRVADTAHFTIYESPGTGCSNRSFDSPQSCTFDVVYHPSESDLGTDQTSIITIPVNDTRVELYVAVSGRCRMVIFLPLVISP